jgi:hypothetical protein
MRLSSDLWVYALIRRVELAGSFATIVRKGDARGGAVLVKTLNRKTGAARLWTEAVGPKGESVWMRPVEREDEAGIDAYIDRAARIDPDIWVVEVEDADGRRFFADPADGD